MIRVRPQCPLCLCLLSEMKGNDKTMKNVNQLIGCWGWTAKNAMPVSPSSQTTMPCARKPPPCGQINVVTITPEMINCIGCCIEGAKTPFCDKLCPVHNCVREKGLDTCADCGQMDGCPTLGQIAVNSPFVLENLK